MAVPNDTPPRTPATPSMPDATSAAVTAGPSLIRSPIIVRHHGLRPVAQADVLAAVGGLAAFGSTIPRDMEIDTSSFSHEVENGSWGASHGVVWRAAHDVRTQLLSTPDARVLYAGIAEVPHVVAFGAYLGDEWTVECYDFHRDTGTWGWPANEQTLALETVGLPRERLTKGGTAVLRVEISASVDDAQVREFVPESDEVAHIRIRPGGGVAPAIADRVRSPADVAEVRRAVREAMTALVELRPNVTTLHLFIAAPVSACFVTGQELRIRNNPPVQTYRYRRGADGSGVTREAIRLASTGPARAVVPPTTEERAQAVAARSALWLPAIRDVERFAERKADAAVQAEEAGAATAPWYATLGGPEWRRALARFHPFPALPLVQRIVERPTVEVVAPDNPEAEFGFQRATKRWLIGDQLALGFERAFPDAAEQRSLARIFLFHEYLHLVHGITKASAAEVGKFGNGLEHADYLSDLYGILHEADVQTDAAPDLRNDFVAFRTRIGALIDLVIRSFWAFEPPAPLDEMEFRRIRRYMNWYWQLERVRMAGDWMQLAAVLVRQPIVEIAGLEPRVESRRHYGSLRRFDPAVGPELGIVLDSEQLYRVKSGVTTPLGELAAAFRAHDHERIQQVFRGVFAEIEGTGNHLPRPEQYPPDRGLTGARR